MTLTIRDAELLAITESDATLSFVVGDASGPVEAEARVRVGGEVRAMSASGGTHLVRVEGLEPATRYSIEIEVPGAEGPAPDDY